MAKNKSNQWESSEHVLDRFFAKFLGAFQPPARQFAGNVGELGISLAPKFDDPENPVEHVFGGFQLIRFVLCHC